MSSSSECVLLEGHVEYMFLTLPPTPYLHVPDLERYLEWNVEGRVGSLNRGMGLLIMPSPIRDRCVAAAAEAS